MIIDKPKRRAETVVGVVVIRSTLECGDDLLKRWSRTRKQLKEELGIDVWASGDFWGLSGSREDIGKGLKLTLTITAVIHKEPLRSRWARALDMIREQYGLEIEWEETEVRERVMQQPESFVKWADDFFKRAVLTKDQAADCYGASKLRASAPPTEETVSKLLESQPWWAGRATLRPPAVGPQWDRMLTFEGAQSFYISEPPSPSANSLRTKEFPGGTFQFSEEREPEPLRKPIDPYRALKKRLLQIDDIEEVLVDNRETGEIEIQLRRSGNVMPDLHLIGVLIHEEVPHLNTFGANWVYINEDLCVRFTFVN